MGIWENIRGALSGGSRPIDTTHASNASPLEVFVGASNDSPFMATFNDKNITYKGDLTNYNYESILKDKQKNINSLFELSDYFTDKDPLIKGIIKGAYTPFSTSSKYHQVGVDEATKTKFLDFYESIDFEDKMRSIFYQFYKYANVYVYLTEEGNIITLPVHRIRISNMISNGEPLLEMDVASITRDLVGSGTSAIKKYLDDGKLEQRLKGFPKEVVEGVKKGAEWVQLNPENTFVLQDLKEDWTRYAVPMIASCLSALSKKALIETYEKNQLTFGASGFLHVTYGDTKAGTHLDSSIASRLKNIFQAAMKGGAVAVTNDLTKVDFVSPDLRFLFENDKYKEVNQEILSAGGISGVIVSGQTDSGSSFASAKVSMETAVMRIQQAQNNFCELMNKINKVLNGKFIKRSATAKIPRFEFEPIDLTESSKFKDTVFKLWKEGVVSSTTLLQNHGIDIDQERRRIKREADIEELNRIRPNFVIEEVVVDEPTSKAPDPDSPTDGEKGRPHMDDNERTSDEGHAMTGKQPKPSNPEGSL